MDEMLCLWRPRSAKEAFTANEVVVAAAYTMAEIVVAAVTTTDEVATAAPPRQLKSWQSLQSQRLGL